MIISLERRLLDASSGGVDGLGEPRGVPKTQILLTPPRVYQVPCGVLRSSRRRFTCPTSAPHRGRSGGGPDLIQLGSSVLAGGVSHAPPPLLTAFGATAGKPY